MRASTIVLAIILAVSLSTGAASAASSKSGKITSSKGCVITVAGGTGYATGSKTLKKGTKVTLKALSAGSKYAKTIAYGKAKGWSAKKLSKALRAPKAYKADTAKYIYYKAYKGKKLRYVVAVKKPTPKPAAKSTPKPAAKPAAKSTPKPAAEEPAPAAPAISQLTIRVMSADPGKYCSEAYSLDGLVMSLEGEQGSFAVAAIGDAAEAAATLEVPRGTYRVWFPRPRQELVYGQSAYWYEPQQINVDSSKEEMSIMLDPVPGHLFIEVSEQSQGAVYLDGVEVDVPCSLEVPAGTHQIELENEKSESIQVVPGAPTGIEL